jgi:hypothetical protein
MQIAEKLFQVRLRLTRIESECDDPAKVLAKEAQAIMVDAVNELQGLSDDLEKFMKK